MLSFLIAWVGNRQLPLKAKNIRYWKGDKSNILRLAGIINVQQYYICGTKTLPWWKKRNIDLLLYRLSVKVEFNEMWTAAELF